MNKCVVKLIERVVEDRCLVGKTKERIDKESNLLYLVVKGNVFLITKNVLKCEIREDAVVVWATVEEEDGKVISVELCGKANDLDRLLKPIGMKLVRPKAKGQLVC